MPHCTPEGPELVRFHCWMCGESVVWPIHLIEQGIAEQARRKNRKEPINLLFYVAICPSCSDTPEEHLEATTKVAIAAALREAPWVRRAKQSEQ